jgi:hypothetical protein
MPLVGQLIHQRLAHSGPRVLRVNPFKIRALTLDRVRPDLRRSEPSSRAILMGEQPNPWNLIQLQDMTSRHRGAEPCRRYERLGKTSLLSPW